MYNLRLMVEPGDQSAGKADKYTCAEFTLPCFKHDPTPTMHGITAANPLIHQDELGLISKYELKYVYIGKPFAVLFPDDRAWSFNTT